MKKNHSLGTFFSILLVGAGLSFSAARAHAQTQYALDDGSAEDSVGFGDGTQNFESIFLNQFNVIPGATMISSVSVVWGTPNFPDPTLNGETVRLGIFSDPNGNSLAGSVLLGSVTGTIQNEGTDTFVSYLFSTPVNLPAGATSFFVGDMTPAHPGFEQFPQGLDETNPQMHSYLAANGDGSPVDFNNPGNNSLTGTIENVSGGALSGNWLIRADAVPEPSTWAMIGLGGALLLGMMRYRARVS